MPEKKQRDIFTLNWLLEELTIPGPMIEISFLVITFVLFLTTGTTQQMVFILYGAPLIYAALKRGLIHGIIIAFFAAVFVSVGRINVLIDNWFAHQWMMLFFEGLFVPFFYLAFSLIIARVMIKERKLKQEYKAVSVRLGQAYNDNLKLFASTISALAATIDAKDAYTSGHSERVSEYVSCMLSKMNLTEEAKRRIYYAAILHDIGKIGIRGEILAKKTGLSDEEFEEIKQHPSIASNILQSIAQMEDVIPIIYHHHERFDGCGYPEGLKGRKIPLGSRIIAVADTYDAITSDRPYRNACTNDWALEEIKRCSGSQFDPDIVKLFLDCYNDFALKKINSTPRDNKLVVQKA